MRRPSTRSLAQRLLAVWLLLLVPAQLGCGPRLESIDLEPHPKALVDGRIAILEGRPADAERIFRAYLQEQPGDIAALRGLQDAARGLGQGEAMLEQARQGVKDAPQDAVAHYLLGRALLASSPSAAMAELDRALELDPGFSMAWAARCYQPLISNQEKGIGADVGGSIACLKECLASSAADPLCAAQLARLLNESGIGLEARTIVNDSLKRWPDSARLWAVKGNISATMGRHQEAAHYLKAAIRAYPADSSWHFALGLALRASGAKEAEWRPAIDYAMRLGFSPSDEQIRDLGLGMRL